MRLLTVAVLVPLWAQEPAPLGIVRGQLLEVEPAEISLRGRDNRVLRFRYDAKTYFEREAGSIESSSLKAGDMVEVVADVQPDIAVRYARTIHVLETPRPVRSPFSSERYRALRSVTEHLAPRGNLTYSGVVLRINEGRMVLRTREGERIFQLRPDTRYLERGAAVAHGDLHPNTRVFVRAGKTFEDQIEVFQVVWGPILDPGAQ